MTTWRLLITPPADGPTVMAVDEAILTHFGATQHFPTLRFYGWIPPAISIGRNQDPAAILDLDRCRTDRVPVVRRITGGGVIYHADEVTYSLTCSPDHLPQGIGVRGSYRVLTTFLLHTYRLLGLSPSYAEQSSTPTLCRSDFCFAGHESFDVLIDGRKLGGNAQRRTRGKIFQHGSIPLENRSLVGGEYMRVTPPGIQLSTTSLRQEGVTLSRERIIGLLADSFRETMGVELASAPLTRDEHLLSLQLAETRYRCEEWNLRGRIPQ